VSGFRLQRLLEHRLRLRDQAQQRLAAMMRQRAAAQLMLDQLTRSHETAAEALQLNLAGTVRGDRLQLLDGQVSGASALIERQTAALVRCGSNESVARADALTADQAYRTLENARRNFDEQERLTRSRQESARLDELSGVRTARAMAGRRGR
jgi:flagellar export protein FliJ